MALSDAVRQALTQQQLATLALNSGAGAAAGFANATSGLQGAQQTALAGATADANKAGVDAAGQAALAKIINAGYDPRLTALAARAGTDAGFYQGQQGAVNTRFAGLQQGVDANEEALNQKIAAQTATGGSSGGGGGGGGGRGGGGGGKKAKAPAADAPFDPLAPSKFFKQYGGVSNFKLLVNQDPGNEVPTGVGAPIITSRGAADQAAAVSVGVPQSYAQHLFPKVEPDITNLPRPYKTTGTNAQGNQQTTTSAFKNDKQQLKVIASPAFQQAWNQSKQFQQSGKTRSQWLAQVKKDTKAAGVDFNKDPRVQFLIALAGPRFLK